MFLRQFPIALAVLVFAGSAFAAQTVTMQRPTPYSEDAVIAGKIKRECSITQQLPAYTAEYAKEKGIDVKFADKVSPATPGRVLIMRITNAVSSGNAFIGHHKATTVVGELYQDGKLIGDFKGLRNSMGGAFAGFKGSCSVLGRTVKALGEDIAGWLTNPDTGALLGDLQ